MPQNDMDRMRAELAIGKYTRWAAELSIDQLVGALWILGEFSTRARADDYSLEGHVAGERRKVAALRCLADIKHRPMTVDDWRKVDWRAPEEASQKPEQPDRRGQRLLEVMLGRRFGALTIVHTAHLDREICFCRCDCGNAVDVEEKQLLGYPRRIACGECHHPATVFAPWVRQQEVRGS